MIRICRLFTSTFLCRNNFFWARNVIQWIYVYWQFKDLDSKNCFYYNVCYFVSVNNICTNNFGPINNFKWLKILSSWYIEDVFLFIFSVIIFLIMGKICNVYYLWLSNMFDYIKFIKIYLIELLTESFFRLR